MSMITQLHARLGQAFQTLNTKDAAWQPYQGYLRQAQNLYRQDQFSKSYMVVVQMAEKMVSDKNMVCFNDAQKLFDTYKQAVGGPPDQALSYLQAAAKNIQAKEPVEQKPAVTIAAKKPARNTSLFTR